MIHNAKLIAVGYDSEAYHHQDAKRGDPAYVMSRSDLHTFMVNPRRWVQGYREDQDDTTATVWGNLLDTRLLDPKRFDVRFAIRPDKYETTILKCPQCGSVTESDMCRKCKCQRHQIKVTKDWQGNATECSDWTAKQAPKTIIKKEDFDAASFAIKQLHEDRNCDFCLANAECQIYCTADWIDKATGQIIPVKILVDMAPFLEFGRDLADLKTGRTAIPKAWRSECWKRGYAMQAALSLDIYTKSTGEDRTGWLHVISENVHPYYCELRRMEQEMIDAGSLQYQTALQLYARCLSTGKWPGYRSPRQIDGISTIAVEAWMHTELLESQPDLQEPAMACDADERLDVPH